MKSKLIILSICLALADSAEVNSEALRECGNLHHLEFRNLPNAHGEYSEKNCRLKCLVGEKILSNDALNEGFACPLDSSGICRNGLCVGTTPTGNTDAIRECGNLHHLDFHNSTGSLFTPDHCLLKCVLNGNLISSNNINEGYSCLNDAKKICRQGVCITDSHNPDPSNPTRKPTTIEPVALIIPNYKIDEIQLQIASLMFLKTTYFVGIQALACIEDPTDGLCHSTDFKRTCHTDAIAGIIKDPHWNHLCYLHGPFNSTDALIVHIRFGSLLEAVGSHTESLNAMFNRHWSAKNFTTVPSTFLVNDLLPVSKLGFVKHEKIADLTVSVTYSLSRV